jgi:hypothetical protein
MKIIKGLIIFFALIGLIAAFQTIIKFNTHQKESKIYNANCKKIKVGMTLKQVRKLMGDSIWNSMKNSPQLYFTYYGGNDVSYELEYSSEFGSSYWPIIKFDTSTMKVSAVICGDK